MTTKIATCCYCGSRTLLKPTARHGHELACGRCGAPLHEMKAMPVQERKAIAKPVKRSPQPVARYRHDDDDDDDWDDRPRRRRKRRKPLWSRALEEAFDFVEDIFD
tara:strand:- start:330 stop:647 length:318 start_codon:yes stop_codon:yes gene_type:complete